MAEENKTPDAPAEQVVDIPNPLAKEPTPPEPKEQVAEAKSEEPPIPGLIVDDETPEEGPEEPDAEKRKTRSTAERARRRVAALGAELSELARQNEELRKRAEQPHDPNAKPGIDRPPTEQDYPNDYMAFDRARIAWDTRQAVRSELARAQQREHEVRALQMREERLERYEENAAEVRERIADYDKKLAAARDIHVADTVAAEIMASDKPALLAYYLAERPSVVRELNALTGAELARAIGRLEGRVHLPKPAAVTKAAPPPKQVQGAASAKSGYPDNMDDYVAQRRTEMERERKLHGRI